MNNLNCKNNKFFFYQSNSCQFVSNFQFLSGKKCNSNIYRTFVQEDLLKLKVIKNNFFSKTFFYKSVSNYKKIYVKKQLYRFFFLIKQQFKKMSKFTPFIFYKNETHFEKHFSIKKNLLFFVMDCLVLQTKILINLLKQINSAFKFKQLELVVSQSFSFTYSFLSFINPTIQTKKTIISKFSHKFENNEIFFFYLKRQFNLKLKLSFLKAFKWQIHMFKEKTFLLSPSFSKKNFSYNLTCSTQLEKYLAKLSSPLFFKKTINRNFFILKTKKNITNLNIENPNFSNHRDFFFSFFPVPLLRHQSRIHIMTLNFKKIWRKSTNNRILSILNFHKNFFQKQPLNQKLIKLFFLEKKNLELSKNLPKIGWINKKKFFLHFVFLKFSNNFLKTKLVLFYFLLELLTLVYKKLIQKRKKYFKFKENTYQTTKFKFSKRYEFIQNLTIKRENVCFSINSRNIIVFSEKLSFFTQLIFLLKILNNLKILILNSFRIYHSLYQTILNRSKKQLGLIINDLQIRFVYKKLPEYNKNINIKNKLMYAVLFIKKELLSEVSIFIILCRNSEQFNHLEFNLLIFQKLNINLSCEKNASQKVKSYFYMPFLFSNKTNRKKISNFKFLRQLNFIENDFSVTDKSYFSLFFPFFIFLKSGLNCFNQENKALFLKDKIRWLSETTYSAFIFHTKKYFWPIMVVEKCSKVFLGTNFYKKSIIHIFPSPENVRLHLKKLKKIIQQSSTKTQEQLIYKLSFEIQIWCSFYKNSASKKIFAYCNYITYKYLWRWACKRHPNKSKRWIKNKYFYVVTNQTGFFSVSQKKTNSMLTLKNHC